MAFFNNFPKINYKFNDTNRTITNHWVRYHYFLSRKQDIDQFCQKYTILDGDTPEGISIKLYGVQDYYWTIFMVNNLTDYIRDFPLSEQALVGYCKEKYGDPEWIEGVHHYENRYGNVVNQTFIDIDGKTVTNGLPISNYDYEQTANDKKRNIRVVNPYFISEFVSKFENAITE